MTVTEPPRTIAEDPSVPEIRSGRDLPDDAKVLGVPVFADLSTPDGAGAEVNAEYLAQRRFEGQPGQVQALLADDGTTIVALGVGPRAEVGASELRRAAAALARNAGAARHVATTLAAAWPDARAGSAVAEGFALGAYRYAGAPARAAASTQVEVLTVLGADRDAVRRGALAAEAACRARDWVNRPPRDLTPTTLARLAERAAEAVGLDVEIWDENRIADEGLGGLLGVSAGASEPPRLIRLEHRPQGLDRGRNKRRSQVVHLVGKGITFDSGGLSIKPAASMMTMKCDMGGAAAVICATLALAELDVPTGVVCWVAATENMPSGTAIHPGDVLRARNGKTIEVLNTDAEGRLVLADALSLAVEEEPDAIVDVATLTGAQRVALGDGMAAIMSTDRALTDRLVEAGSQAGEPLWELPLWAPYRKLLDSEVADIKNVAANAGAGTIIAGLFLKEFAGDVPWAHLDIAAPAWTESDDGLLKRGATGWGTRTLIELVRSWGD